ncbi:hypothetical protein AK830_g12314 [Neonectria ditissima]|uniref:Zn(2)-C6 fungal-type domain-containing protein n=1 Tax=Neonectria ditissima TaxID=78410 RepID=A0A0P7AZC0_9HYPO|nr:hypothetical protein AK830_g12314 [Neonectria ditissima]
MSNKRQAKADDSLTAFKPRAGANPRSRAGCLTCKAKHVWHFFLLFSFVSLSFWLFFLDFSIITCAPEPAADSANKTKCDETRPECLRCTRKGIKCGGYWREFKWSFKHQPGSQDAVVEFEVADAPDGRLAAPAPAPAPAPAARAVAPLVRRPRHAASLSRDSISAPVPSATGDGEDSSLALRGDSAESDMPPRKAARRTSVARPRTATSAHDASSSALLPADHFAERPVFMPASITDTSSLLISNWFEQVCPAWSGFDSAANLNRKLATELWHESRSVFSSLQSMSAAFLSTRLPHMRQPAVRFMQTATESIQAEVKAIRNCVHLDAVPTGLLFSLFCLGTTVCWIDASQLGLPFFREARLLLDRLNRRLPSLYQKDVELLSFFNKSLTYCEMLLAVVSDGDLSTGTEMPNLAQQTQGSTGKDGCAESSDKGVDNYPHPWTGISTVTSRLFAESIRLCRTFRHNTRQQKDTGRDFHTALQEIQAAQRLEEQLLELEFPSMLPNSDTGDDRTPYFHLARVAEAYQLASLLQLYQTFPDLVSLRLPINDVTSTGGSISWEEWIIPLSLRLVRVLEHIPPSSGSRAIQPLLYISASTGLRYDMKAPAEALDCPWNLGMGSMEAPFRPRYDYGGGLGPLSETQMHTLAPASISRMSLDVSNARHFIMGRLGILENSLPPKPVIVAKTLIRAIWDAYDGEMPGSTAVHWVDVMEDNNLRTMFG